MARPDADRASAGRSRRASGEGRPDTNARATGAWSSHAAALLVLAGALAAASRALYLALENRVALGIVDGSVFPLEALLLSLGVLAAPLAAAGEIAAARRGDARARPLAPLSALAIVAVAGWVLFLAFAQPFQRLRFDLGLGLAGGAQAALVLAERRAGAPLARGARQAWLAATSLALTLVLAELGLRALALARPSPLLARVSDGPRRQLARFRLAPGEVRFGFPCNSRGYYDDEFVQKREGERRIASIGDSFHVGAVPHAYNAATIAERALGIPIDAFGVSAAGPPEYLTMLVDEALPLGPDLVVIQLFVGNDLSYGNVARDDLSPRLRAWFERDRVLLAVLPRRLARVAAERSAALDPRRAVSEPQGVRESSFPWLEDPSLEQPTLSEEAFLEVETRRALEVCRGVPSAFADACRTLLDARRAAGGISLRVVIVPDEFQVEDELWRAVEAQAGVPLERDLPQQLLAAFLAREGIAFLDLLPVLREVEPLENGRRHLYHLRDTHWNARGNRVAGEAIARFLRKDFEEAQAGSSR